MSFGFSIGDFIAVIELANKIRKDFVDAPTQFKAISEEYAILTTFLSNADSVNGTGSEASRLSFSMSKLSSNRELHSEQEAQLKQVVNSCRNVFNELEHTLDRYDELKSGHGSVCQRMKRV